MGDWTLDGKEIPPAARMGSLTPLPTLLPRNVSLVCVNLAMNEIYES